ncbi:MAG: hypothetical protein WC331_10015 [Candidatus Omnitrophota bacterium]|jgi:hypothetical protein
MDKCYIEFMAATTIQACRFCGEEMPSNKVFAHEWAAHRVERLAELDNARKAKAEKKAAAEGVSAKGNGHPSSSETSTVKESKSPMKVTADIGEAVAVTIAPKRFEMESTLLWQAREVAIREWDWPTDISPGDFLDTYLFESFKQRGVMLGAYQIIDRNRGRNQEDGN